MISLKLLESRLQPPTKYQTDNHCKPAFLRPRRAPAAFRGRARELVRSSAFVYTAIEALFVLVIWRPDRRFVAICEAGLSQRRGTGRRCVEVA